MTSNILGISAYYHDSAAALLRDGEIISAAQEERFTRKKHDASFPSHAIQYCLKEAGISLQEVDYIAFYDKPLVKFERLLETYLSYAPRGFLSFLAAMPVWLKEKLYLKSLLKRELAELSGVNKKELPPLMFTEHHQSHAASAFFPSPFEKAAVLCLDGVGEWATTSAWMGEGNTLIPLWQIDFPHSLGLLYSAFTYYIGFRVNSGEYKLMGLAPYGEPRYVDLILSHLIDLKEDGTFRLHMEYFNFATGLTMTNKKFDRLFGGPPRIPESRIGQREMDIAASIQVVTEQVVLRLAQTVQRETQAEYLCLAGGVALNCVANGRLLREGIFKDLWIQPAAGDAGGALGAACSVWYQYCEEPRVCTGTDSNAKKIQGDRMKGSFLGPRFHTGEIKKSLDALDATYHIYEDGELMPRLVDILAEGHVVGWFQGRMEFGPRALGGRSILGDPRNPEMQPVMNLKIKYRESFRPFAPSILADRVSEYFEHDRPSPYMLMVAPVLKSLRILMTPEQQKLFGIEKLHIPRSQYPAITHVDFSARIQTVHKESNPRFHSLLRHFEQKTGSAILINTSFNVRGEPIVCSPEDAYRCFMRTGMDYLVLENILLAKAEQPPLEEGTLAMTPLELD